MDQCLDRQLHTKSLKASNHRMTMHSYLKYMYSANECKHLDVRPQGIAYSNTSDKTMQSSWYLTVTQQESQYDVWRSDVTRKHYVTHFLFIQSYLCGMAKLQCAYVQGQMHTTCGMYVHQHIADVSLFGPGILSYTSKAMNLFYQQRRVRCTFT